VRDSGIPPLLEALRSPNAREAWVEFLNGYSAVLYQTARNCTSTDDDAADCFVSICEQLAHNQFRRLLKFNPAGSASFVTWLRVVARNLCFDWHRKQSGRLRTFKSLQNLSALELEIYNQRFVHSVSPEETLARLEPLFPNVSMAELRTIEESIQQSLNPRQQWILVSRRAGLVATVAAAADDRGSWRNRSGRFASGSRTAHQRSARAGIASESECLTSQGRKAPLTASI
jgi:RNA polymerase sigma factor, sigma-70 family